MLAVEPDFIAPATKNSNEKLTLPLEFAIHSLLLIEELSSHSWDRYRFYFLMIFRER